MSLAVHRTCDGCGEPGDSMERLLGLDYCAGCIVPVRDFMEEVDKLHNDIAAAWREKLEALRIQYKDVSGIKELPY